MTKSNSTPKKLDPSLDNNINNDNINIIMNVVK